MEEASVELFRNIQPLLITWYLENRKEMPWRNQPEPYRVWVSEIMLQQTRTAAVIGYYQRFMEAFPTVQKLAAADDEQLMKVWQGLGYYSRARNLKKAANILVQNYRGELPQDYEKLRQLPGIGAYSAGAIASIAYHLPEPAVDGNVLRVCMRLLSCSDDVLLEKTKVHLRNALKKVYPAGKEAAWLTEGLMELGETVCLPGKGADCPNCPLATLCQSRNTDTVEKYPVRVSKTKRRVENKTVLLLLCRDRIAIQKRPEKGLLAGLWEFPSLDGFTGEEEIRNWAEQHAMQPLEIKPCGESRHLFSHVEWKMKGYLLCCKNESGAFTYVTRKELREEKALPSAYTYFIRHLFE